MFNHFLIEAFANRLQFNMKKMIFENNTEKKVKVLSVVCFKMRRRFRNFDNKVDKLQISKARGNRCPPWDYSNALCGYLKTWNELTMCGNLSNASETKPRVPTHSIKFPTKMGDQDIDHVKLSNYAQTNHNRSLDLKIIRFFSILIRSHCCK